MAENLKALSAVPVFGFEYSGCHAVIEDEDCNYSDRNKVKLLACIPIMNFLCGIVMIKGAVKMLSMTAEDAKKDCGIEHQKTKAAAQIARGVATLFFAGVLFAVVDAATLAGRVACRPKQQEEQ